MESIKFLIMFFLLSSFMLAQSLYNSSYSGEQIDNGVRPYKVYSAMLTQSGTNAPVATVLENNVGTVTITRSDVGNYIITSAGFVADRIWLNFKYQYEPENQYSYYFAVTGIEGTTISLITTVGGSPTDGALDAYCIEIRVYP